MKDDLDRIKSVFPFLTFKTDYNVVQVTNYQKANATWRHFGWVSDINIWSYENMIHQLYSIYPELEQKVSERSMNIMAAKDPTKAGTETAELFVGFLRADVPQMNFYKLAGKLAVWDGYQGESILEYVNGAMEVFMQFQLAQATVNTKQIATTNTVEHDY